MTNKDLLKRLAEIRQGLAKTGTRLFSNVYDMQEVARAKAELTLLETELTAIKEGTAS